MVTQQVVADQTKAAIFMVVEVDEGAQDRVVEMLPDISGLTRTVGFRGPGEHLNATIGIGAKLWDRMWGADTRPLHLHTFEEIRGAKHTAVATGGDLLIHLRADRPDLVFKLAWLIKDAFSEFAHVTDEVHGFRYFDVRDLLGFVDGTENPEGLDALHSTMVGQEDPAYEGGSYVIVQKYLHNMEAWHSIGVEEQQRVIGRTKEGNVEFPDSIKPSNSHVALNTIEDDEGTQLQILRDNMPFGRVGSDEFGTYFIGYARNPEVTEQMLRNMFIGKPEGNYDRILDFSTAHTGALFFTPPLGFLDDPKPVKRDLRKLAEEAPALEPTPPADAHPGAEESALQQPEESAPSTPPANGSLAIGSLKN